MACSKGVVVGGKALRDTKRLAGFLVISVAAGFWLLSDNQDSYQPTVDPRAYLQFAFEEDLQSLSDVQVEATVKNGSVVFGHGDSGRTFRSRGDGAALFIVTPELKELAETVEIEFDFRVEDWTNPYKKSAPVQTMVVVSGKSGGQFRHLSISMLAHKKAKLRIAAESSQGTKAEVIAAPDGLLENWHNVRIVVDQSRPQTEVFLNYIKIGHMNLLPSTIEDGIEQIKIGTWHLQNQAFRGQIDNFVVRDGTS
ncbi:MAG: hypothetical protein AAGI36_02130 [Pseudomonadota bacterium]